MRSSRSRRLEKSRPSMRWDCESVAKRVSRLVGLASIKKVKVEGSRFAWEQAAAKQASVARKKAKDSLATSGIPKPEEGSTSMGRDEEPLRAAESWARMRGLRAPPPETMS